MIGVFRGSCIFTCPVQVFAFLLMYRLNVIKALEALFFNFRQAGRFSLFQVCILS